MPQPNYADWKRSDHYNNLPPLRNVDSLPRYFGARRLSTIHQFPFETVPTFGSNTTEVFLKPLMPSTSPAVPAVFGPVPNREYHEGFMRKAIEMAELALASDETPVGCVFVHNGEIIGRGINGTNASLNVCPSFFLLCCSEALTRLREPATPSSSLLRRSWLSIPRASSSRPTSTSLSNRALCVLLRCDSTASALFTLGV